MCSTQLEFEWTIDEVSSLNPANVEAHETQFQSVVDPEFEAKAQAAISTYFKEQHTGNCEYISCRYYHFQIDCILCVSVGFFCSC